MTSDDDVPLDQLRKKEQKRAKKLSKKKQVFDGSDTDPEDDDYLPGRDARFERAVRPSAKRPVVIDKEYKGFMYNDDRVTTDPHFWSSEKGPLHFDNLPKGASKVSSPPNCTPLLSQPLSPSSPFQVKNGRVLRAEPKPVVIDKDYLYKYYGSDFMPTEPESEDDLDDREPKRIKLDDGSFISDVSSVNTSDLSSLDDDDSSSPEADHTIKARIKKQVKKDKTKKQPKKDEPAPAAPAAPEQYHDPEEFENTWAE